MTWKNKLSSGIRTLQNKKGKAIFGSILSMAGIAGIVIPAIVFGSENVPEATKNVIFNRGEKVDLEQRARNLLSATAKNAELTAENAELTAKNAELTAEIEQWMTFARNVLSEQEWAVVLDLNHFGATDNLAAFVMKMTQENVRYEVLEKIYEIYGSLPVLTNAGYGLLSEVLDTIDEDVLSPQNDDSTVLQQQEKSAESAQLAVLTGQVWRNSENLRKRSESHVWALKTAGKYMRRSRIFEKLNDKWMQFSYSIMSAEERAIIADLNFFAVEANLVGFLQKMRAENVGYTLLEKIFESYGSLPILTDEGYSLLSEILDSAKTLLPADESRPASQQIALNILAELQKKYGWNAPSQIFFETKENVGLDDSASSETTILWVEQNWISPEGDAFAKIAIAVFDWEATLDGFWIRAYKDFGTGISDKTSEFYVINDVSEPLLVQNVQVELDS